MMPTHQGDVAGDARKYVLLDHLPSLRTLLEPGGIRLVDVGGRGGAVPQLLPYAPIAHYYSFEPDAEEARRLSETLTKNTAWRSVTVVPAALARHEGVATLNLTEKAGMSSLLHPNPAVAERFYESHAFDVHERVEVPTLSLDRAASRYGFADACFLKLDTQGTELDVLQSGATILERSVLGVYVEALFQPFYENQALFADVDAHLRGNGFTLFGLSRTLRRRAGYRPDVYSRRPIVWAHCLYLREPASLVASDTRDRSALLRLLLLALAFKYFDVALEILQLASERQLFPTVWPAVVKETEASISEQTRWLVKEASQSIARERPDPAAATALLLAAWRKDDRARD